MCVVTGTYDTYGTRDETDGSLEVASRLQQCTSASLIISNFKANKYI